jgi:sugar O-acyltransferase (sialic acid O-acetyltransferase NeuD family)
MSRMRVAIIGAGGHSKVIADAILAADCDQIFGFFDDNPSLWQNTLLGFSVIGPVNSWQHHSIDAFVLGIGDNTARKKMFEMLRSLGAKFTCVVHPRATLGRGVTLGEGTVVFANVVVNSNTQIGPDCILNTACTVDHDSVIAAHAHVAPGVNAAAEVRIGEGAFVCIGARIIPRMSIGDWAIVGAGAVVTRDVKAGAKVVGMPAKTI